MKNSILIICFLLAAGSLFAQSTIADARLQAVGSIVTVSGIVTNGDELGSIRYFQDSTAGIAVYDYDVVYFAPGDSITITGTLDDYNNLLEIKSVTAHTIDSGGNPLPQPQLITPIGLNEDTESELVQIDNAIFNNAGSTFQAGNSYSFTASGETSTVYIRTGHPLVGDVIPGNPVTLIGLCSQFYANYQLLLRTPNDIINLSSINIISPINMSNISTNSFTLDWFTDAAGSTEIIYGLTPELELDSLLVPGTISFHSIDLTNLEPATIYYVKAFSVLNSDTAFSNVRSFCTQSLSSGLTKVYFSKSVDTSVSTGNDAIYLDDAIDDTLIAYINRAEYSIDFTIYDYNPANISDIATALNNAHANGVIVRAIYDTTWSTVDFANLLSPNIHSIAAPATAEYGIMHNKFVVFDANSSDTEGAIVWTGSTNFEDENINTFANNVIIIHDQSLARTYRAEFNEMWGSNGDTPNLSESRFGPFKKDNTPHNFIIGGRQSACYFSPSDQTTSKIAAAISTADDELYVETMLITRYDLKDSIIARVNAGVLTKIILDSIYNQSIVNDLESAIGNNFKLYGEAGIMHNKVMIVDPGTSNTILLTGSHNWSNSAENRNDENTLILHNPEVANLYLQEFTRRFQNAWLLNTPVIKEYVSETILYPNPTRGIFHIDLGNYKGKIDHLIISDIQGKELYIKENPAISGRKISIYDFQSKPGSYFISVYGDGFSETFLLNLVE
ncbi:MAG: phospholipase D-like domain-containing protein [Bacteroidota bacterium]|nr:phospholipase D-like domain-containing protein [Bacteroidota bacterium]